MYIIHYMHIYIYSKSKDIPYTVYIHIFQMIYDSYDFKCVYIYIYTPHLANLCPVFGSSRSLGGSSGGYHRGAGQDAGRILEVGQIWGF